MGNADVPNSPTATAACACVNGSTACASVQFRRSRPKKPRLHATPRSANLTASVRPRAVSVGTGDLLQGDMLSAEGPAQLVDRFEALEPGRAGKDVDVHRACLRPGMKDGVRFAEDQDAGQAGFRKRMGDLACNRRARPPQRRAERGHDLVCRAPDEIRAAAEVDRVEGWW